MTGEALGFMQFADPEWLWLPVAAIAVFGLLIWRSAAVRREQMAGFADKAQLAQLLSAHSPRRRAVKHFLTGVTLLILGLAMARPQWGLTEERATRTKGDDVVFVLDLSNSMLARDVSPSRLERAKTAIREFVYREGGQGRVGLVMFAGNAFLRCPLTSDYAAFDESVTEASPTDLYVPGTDVGSALAVAKDAFEKNNPRKVVVLLTDGEDLAESGVKVAEEYGKEGIVIFTIGLGTAAGAELRVEQENGQVVTVTDEKGQPVVSKLDEEKLKKIASATGGSYRRLDRLSDATTDVMRALRQYEVSTLTGKFRRRGVDRYQWFLAVAILILVIESLLATRRRPKPAAVHNS